MPVVADFIFDLYCSTDHGDLHSFPTRRSSDLTFETWFKDMNSTYNHPRARILRSDDNTSAHQPHYEPIYSILLYMSLRSGGAARTVNFNLATGASRPTLGIISLPASAPASTCS